MFIYIIYQFAAMGIYCVSAAHPAWVAQLLWGMEEGASPPGGLRDPTALCSLRKWLNPSSEPTCLKSCPQPGLEPHQDKHISEGSWQVSSSAYHMIICNLPLTKKRVPPERSFKVRNCFRRVCASAWLSCSLGTVELQAPSCATSALVCIFISRIFFFSPELLK